MSDERTNMCWIAGIIRVLKVEKDKAFLLVDAGENMKFIRCTVWEDAQLSKILSNFAVDDFIRIVGWLNGWSTKKNGEWHNSYDVRITQVKNNPPKRESKPKPKPVPIPVAAGGDDDIPF